MSYNPPINNYYYISIQKFQNLLREVISSAYETNKEIIAHDYLSDTRCLTYAHKPNANYYSASHLLSELRDNVMMIFITPYKALCLPLDKYWGPLV
jgi:hypothetical protein